MNNRGQGQRIAANRAEADEMAAASLLRELVAAAFLTVTLYLTAGAYLLGYQDQFGFTYLSLGLEDLVITSRAVTIQLLHAIAAVSVGWAAIRAFNRWQLTLVDALIAFLPLALCIAFALTTFRHADILALDVQTFVALAAYYVIELLILGCRTKKPKALERLSGQLGALRLVQAVIGSMLLLLLAYNVGIVDARNQTTFSFCPEAEGKAWVMVQQTGELTVCAEADVARGTIYSRFRYIKIGERDGALVLTTRAFVPKMIGALPKGS